MGTRNRINFWAVPTYCNLLRWNIYHENRVMCGFSYFSMIFEYKLLDISQKDWSKIAWNVIFKNTTFYSTLLEKSQVTWTYLVRPISKKTGFFRFLKISGQTTKILWYIYTEIHKILPVTLTKFQATSPSVTHQASTSILNLW